jgi:hypothetical protein
VLSRKGEIFETMKGLACIIWGVANSPLAHDKYNGMSIGWVTWVIGVGAEGLVGSRRQADTRSMFNTYAALVTSFNPYYNTCDLSRCNSQRV